MTDDNRTYLVLHLHGQEDSKVTVECLPLDSGSDGVWVRTSLNTYLFKWEVTWFLASISQCELASIYSGLIYGKRFSEFAICDTDCSFTMTFKPDLSSEHVGVRIEVRYCLEENGPAMVLDLQHATSRMSEVQTFLQRVAQFS